MTFYSVENKRSCGENEGYEDVPMPSRFTFLGETGTWWAIVLGADLATSFATVFGGEYASGLLGGIICVMAILIRKYGGQ